MCIRRHADFLFAPLDLSANHRTKPNGLGRYLRCCPGTEARNPCTQPVARVHTLDSIDHARWAIVLKCDPKLVRLAHPELLPYLETKEASAVVSQLHQKPPLSLPSCLCLTHANHHRCHSVESLMKVPYDTFTFIRMKPVAKSTQMNIDEGRAHERARSSLRSGL